VTSNVFEGINGSNPLGFMAAVGLLRLLDARGNRARLGFEEDGGFHAWIECNPALDDISGVITRDAEAAAGPQPWRLQYEKKEKRGTKVVADLKAPPDQFSHFLTSAVGEWLAGRPERCEYATAYGTDVARDQKGNTKPTAFHFTAANQQFLGAVEETRGRLTKDWVEQSLRDQDGKSKPGTNLRWDPDAERNRALMGVNPVGPGTSVDAPLEWLAFRGLPAFPCVPVGNRIMTCGVTGRRQDDFLFHWPLWSCGASYATVRSLLLLTADWVAKDEKTKRQIEANSGGSQRSRLRHKLEGAVRERRARGVFAICTSSIRRTAQGFGSFGPSRVHG
jgi:hypothetical protein